MPSGPRIRTDNVFGTVSDNPLTAGATTLNSAGLANLAAVSSAHAVIVLDPLRSAGAPEVVIVTAHTGAATSATVTRGAYGTSARQHASGVLWVHAPTIEDVIRIVTSSTRPSDPYNGQLIYETDTDSYVGRDASGAWQTAVPLGAWTSYTPTLTQSATVTKTVTTAKFTRIGRTIHAAGHLVVTGAGTAGNSVLMGFPAAPKADTVVVGTVWIYDASATTRYVCTATIVSPTDAAFQHDTSGANDFGVAPAVTLASSDQIRYLLTYEAAS